MNVVEAVEQVCLRFGSAWVMWLLFALSAVSVGVIVERWLYFRGRIGERGLVRRLDVALADDDEDAAFALLRGSGAVSCRVAEAGLRLRLRGVAAAERAMQSAEAAERALLDRRLAVLGTLGNNAPFVGLLGTVIGVVSAFDELGRASGATATGLGPSAAVMGAIAEALVATAVGIAVALPAVAAYNYFQARVVAALDESEAVSKLVLAYLSTNHPSPSQEA